MDTCQSELDFEEYLESIEVGFKDDYDVKICAFLILLRIAQTAPNAIGSRIERLHDTFKTVLTHRVKVFLKGTHCRFFFYKLLWFLEIIQVELS